MEGENNKEAAGGADEGIVQPTQPVQQAQPQQQQDSQPSEQRPSLVSRGWTRLKAFSGECSRVLRVTKKPDRSEFAVIVKISGIGILVIGFIGFLIHFIKELAF